ncbi:OsmC family protein [Bifidobacterium catulorum]|uniref:Peroxiredoxin n=1 Tax=Bifidobacterium catulorum TaxID=1630173 RepID=A0A2U2MUU1_9BIFI|nr:OsmC family protein [Bifidobacterium catulorum]PWG60619.1 peroxiredoxin [Bifidobacterium catulorum]
MGKRIWVERNKDGSWDARSEDGAHIKFGKGKGLFTPGDLMKVALAGCAALSSQFAVERALGEGAGATITVDGTADAKHNAYSDFSEQVEIDASGAGLRKAQVDDLKERVRRHIEKGCTVQHTYERETPVSLAIDIKE